jgi:hypothetical protein
MSPRMLPPPCRYHDLGRGAVLVQRGGHSLDYFVEMITIGSMVVL